MFLIETSRVLEAASLQSAARYGPIAKGILLSQVLWAVQDFSIAQK